MGDEKDELLARVEEMVADALAEDEFGRQYVVEAPELLEEILREFDKARVQGVIKYPRPA